MEDNPTNKTRELIVGPKPLFVGINEDTLFSSSVSRRKIWPTHVVKAADFIHDLYMLNPIDAIGVSLQINAVAHNYGYSERILIIPLGNRECQLRTIYGGMEVVKTYCDGSDTGEFICLTDSRICPVDIPKHNAISIDPESQIADIIEPLGDNSNVSPTEVTPAESTWRSLWGLI
jgi:hypothetical protein